MWKHTDQEGALVIQLHGVLSFLVLYPFIVPQNGTKCKRGRKFHGMKIVFCRYEKLVFIGLLGLLYCGGEGGEAPFTKRERGAVSEGGKPSDARGSARRFAIIKPLCIKAKTRYDP